MTLVNKITKFIAVAAICMGAATSVIAQQDDDDDPLAGCITPECLQLPADITITNFLPISAPLAGAAFLGVVLGAGGSDATNSTTSTTSTN